MGTDWTLTLGSVLSVSFQKEWGLQGRKAHPSAGGVGSYREGDQARRCCRSKWIHGGGGRKCHGLAELFEAGSGVSNCRRRGGQGNQRGRAVMKTAIGAT